MSNAPFHDMKWRQGRSVGRTIYAVDKDGDGELIGVMDSPSLAQRVVEDHNARLVVGDGDR